MDEMGGGEAMEADGFAVKEDNDVAEVEGSREGHRCTWLLCIFHVGFWGVLYVHRNGQK